MSILRFDLLILAMVLGGLFITGIYLFMLAAPRNDDEHIHDGIGEPGHMKTHFLQALARLRRRFSR
jgi:hypothetical protein